MTKNPQRAAVRKENATNVGAIAVIATILAVGSIPAFFQLSAILGLLSGQ